MPATVSFHPEAIADLEEVLEHLADRSPTAAKRLQAALEHAFEQIRIAPQRWREFEPGVRRYVLRRHDYSVHYRVTPTGVLITTIVHQAPEPGYGRDR